MSGPSGDRPGDGDAARTAAGVGASPGPATARAGSATVRVVLPEHLRTLARVGREIVVRVPTPVTLTAVLDAVEVEFPVLRGSIREHGTLRRRAFVRFFAVGRDLSHEAPDSPLPVEVAQGREPFVVVGAMAGG